MVYAKYIDSRAKKLMQVCNTSRAVRSLAEGNDFFALLKIVTLGLLGLRITGYKYAQ